MSVALVGLIGVIAGALIGGWMNSLLEERKRLHDAVAAKRLIAGELSEAAIRVEGAIDAGEWPADLSDQRWSDGASGLLAALDARTVEKLNAAYGLLEAWIDESRRQHEAAPNNEEKAHFREGTRVLQDASKRLAKRELDPERAARRRRRTYTPVGAVLGFAIVAVLVVAALVPRSDLNDRTIASALQSKLGAPTLVSCTDRGDDWLCHASLEPQRRPTCGSPTATRVARSRSEAVALVGTPRCSKFAPRSEAVEVAKSADGLLARGLSGTLRAAQRQIDTYFSEPEESELEDIVDSVTGEK